MRVTDRHLTSRQVDDVVCPLLGRVGAGADELIPDAVAATVAAWWQAPSGTGQHLAALASGADVDLHALREDVDDTIADWRTGEVPDDAARVEDREWNGTLLNLLAAWAEDRLAACDCPDCQAERAADADTDRWQECDWS